jgi:TetR/AcrR family transcriptional repressor of nem operon
MARPSDSRQRLLDAALDLIWTQSFEGVSVDQICERAGVNKGSFYHFFPSKSELAVAAYEAGWHEWKARYDTVFSLQSNPVQRLMDWCSLIRKHQQEIAAKYGRICGCPISSIGTEMAAIDERLRHVCEDIFQRDLRYLESTIREAQSSGLAAPGDPHSIAASLQAVTIGMLQQARIRNDLAVLDPLEESVRRLGGILSPSS